jgi:Family of unknown function (DUF5681)
MAKIECRDGRRNNRAPVNHQFKPGQSGNKRGRPSNRTRVSANETIGRLLGEKHPIVLRGRKKIVSVKEMIFMRIFELACKGDPKAIMLAMDLIERAEFVESECVKQAASIPRYRIDELNNMSVQELEAEYRRLMESNLRTNMK